MDERTRGLTGTGTSTPTSASPSESEPSTARLDPEQQSQRLEEKVEAIRDNLGGLVSELDRRRHRAAKPLLIGAVVLSGLAVAGVVAVVLARRRKRTRSSRLQKLRQAWQRASAHPERVATPQPNAKKQLFVAAGGAVISVLARQLARRLLPATPSR